MPDTKKQQEVLILAFDVSESELKFRPLRECEIDVRVGTIGDGYATLLLYKDARVDMNILDETVGPMNWQRDHKEIKGNLYGGVGIWDAKKAEWIWKWDCGVESNTEKEKGESSDSFKRACTNAGIGRELYNSPRIKVNCATDRFTDKNGLTKYRLSNQWQFWGAFVSKIIYGEDRSIIHLEICNSKGEVIYSMDEQPKQKKDTPEERRRLEHPTSGGISTLIRLADEKGSSLDDIKAHYGVSRLEEMTMEQYTDCFVKLKRKKGADNENA